jgi:HEAT repeat protein
VVLNNSTVPKRRIGGGDKLTDLQWVDLDNDWNEGIGKLVSVILDESLSNDSELKPDMIERARAWRRAERLTDQLLDPTSSEADRRYAAKELKSISFNPPIVLSAFRKALNDEDEMVRKIAIDWLVAMDPIAADVIVKALESMESACVALGNLGIKAESAKPALTKALKHESPVVQSAARKALDRIDPKPESMS